MCCLNFFIFIGNATVLEEPRDNDYSNTDDVKILQG